MKLSALILTFLHFSNAQDCFEYNIDYDGIDIDDGLHTKTDTAEECQAMCKQNVACEGFTWTTDKFFGNKFSKI